MAESTLSISYTGLSSEVGAFLGYGGTSANWSDAQAAEIERYVQAGVRQFYFPPAVDGVEPGFEWSFLRPSASINTAEDDADQDLPDDCANLASDFFFEPTLRNRSVVVVAVPRLMQLRQTEDRAGAPLYAAVQSKAQSTGVGQRLEVMWWPKPDAIYSLSYRYDAYSGALNGTTHLYPLGGMQFSELVLESCLAVAEQRANDEKGLNWDCFVRLLVAGVALDRRRGARFFGHMGGAGGDIVPRREAVRTSSDITYKGETW